VYKRKNIKRSGNMLNDEICKKRDELNNSIINGKDYSVVYQLSIELDELIAMYYKENKNKKKTTAIK
jgi:hypothetical protein